MAIKTITFNYTGDVQTFMIPLNTKRIIIECWGASGGGNYNLGGKGGYVKGTWDYPPTNQTLYIYVGQVGQVLYGGWNGGGSAAASNGFGGGGASDVRTIGGNWNDISSLSSRVIVGAGGGGSDDGLQGACGGNGGGLIGSAGTGGGCGGGASQIASAGPNYGGFGYGGNGNNYDSGGGGGGYYGGGASNGNNAGGGGGSSYYGKLLDPQTTVGINSGNGKVVITYEEISYISFLKKNDEYYMPISKYFDPNTNTFSSVTLADVINQINEDPRLIEYNRLNNTFSIDNKIYTPFKLIDLMQYQICLMPLNGTILSKISLSYIPSEIAISKTNIKIKERYEPNLYKLSPNDYISYLDIGTLDKTKLDYYIENDSDKSIIYKNCSVLHDDIVINNFYLNIKFNSYDGLFNSITLYGKSNDKYIKLKSTNVDVYSKFNFEMLISFKENYEEVMVNMIEKQSLDYTIDTLDKF